MTTHKQVKVIPWEGDALHAQRWGVALEYSDGSGAAYPVGSEKEANAEAGRQMMTWALDNFEALPQ
jgi:hypothetical protein